ncbi:MAG TPA: hypothetical protein PLI57_07660, partial [Spirochaetota bacterium]|nr:hypothetical protein [Spirochaetota bacterium]
MKKNFIISLPLLLAFISCPTSGPTSNEQTPNVMPAAQSGAFLDVSYGAHPGNKMDVYLCKNIELNTP